MDEKSSLKLLKKPTEVRRCCPTDGPHSSETPCPNGKPQFDAEGKVLEDLAGSSWWINSVDHQHCFWRYVRDKSDVNGVMKELVQSELATLFGWSNTKTHFMLKQAIEELTQALKLYGASELLEDLDAEGGLENLVIPEDLADLPADETSE